MLSQAEQAKDKWGGSHSAIDSWLHERQMLLVQYCELAGLPPFNRENDALPDKTAISSFCEILVDYVSAGHFEVYDQIVDEDKNGSLGLQLKESLYPKISETTDDALTFNDYYADAQDDEALTNFDKQLSDLGQKLEERFALEDQLIQSIHSVNN